VRIDHTNGTISFAGGSVDPANVSIVFELPDESMEDWNTAYELKRKQRHDEWLLSELGEPPWRYNRGEVISEFYHQHCGSEIGVFYKS